MTLFIVEVVALVCWDDLDPDDLDDEGLCTVDGAWLVDAEDEEAALDRFHDRAPISVPDDFLVTVRPRRPEDSFLSVREVL
ncbi:hypothetical protein HOY34_07770 [Xinfangfangia sp. D13-10-4-6]|uniref:hypothetical protein n=1 Tax=Pseudogemmobacter hezensis TaxID=2737662 RepID=UPI0015523885|nr:hypothetical protein [Pseudogemmobacter hezensis]NPD15098.1 hypothetical protein [Pseudogemmobacter hezensis]